MDPISGGHDPLELRQLEMLRTVAEEHSFTRAGHRLHVSQSAISRQIKLLEEELGEVLLHRGGRLVTLTPAGEALFAAANRILRDVQEVVAQLSDARGLKRGRVRLGGGMTVCLYIFPKLLRAFRREHKQVDFRVVSGTSEQILGRIRSHDVDLGLLTLPISARDLEVIPVLKEEMVVVAGAGHPLTRGGTVEAAELGRFPMILYEAGSNTRKVIDGFFVEEGVAAEVAMETENVEIIKAMVSSGIGVTVVPYSAVAREVRAGRFSCARIRGRKLFRETGWVYLKTDPLPRAAAELLRVFDAVKTQLVIRRFAG
jgi:DNA-binding transcriptional LysR family regulator